MAQEELFWAFLEDGCPLEDLKKLRLESFDWSSRDSDGKTMLVVHIHSALINSSSFPDSLRALEWLIVSGASIEQKCTGGASNFWWEEKPQVPKIRVECKGLTSISYVRELQRKMREHLSDWKDQEAFLAKVLKSFAAACGSRGVGPRVSIHEGIVELWEKSLAAKASHDLTIETADGMVTAHAHMMKAASPVVSAMLESPMKEGRTQCIEIKDTSNKAASLLLEILGFFRTDGCMQKICC